MIIKTLHKPGLSHYIITDDKVKSHSNRKNFGNALQNFNFKHNLLKVKV